MRAPARKLGKLASCQTANRRFAEHCLGHDMHDASNKEAGEGGKALRRTARRRTIMMSQAALRDVHACAALWSSHQHPLDIC